MGRTKEIARKSTTTKVSKKAPVIGRNTGMMKPHKFRPGVVVLREIRKYQKSTDLLIKKLPFQRLVKEIAQEHRQYIRFQSNALLAIQQAA